MSKKLPDLTSDEEAERFIDTADLSQFDLKAMKPHSFEFAKKSKQVTPHNPAIGFRMIADEIQAKKSRCALSKTHQFSTFDRIGQSLRLRIVKTANKGNCVTAEGIEQFGLRNE